jgi:tRNA(Arg) A34 adenosine deaminase TadA
MTPDPDFPLHIHLNIHPELAALARGLTAPDPESRMTAVLDWADWNIDQGEGPFAAGIFDLATGRCVSAGVNRVVHSACSLAHAEIMAIMLAQQALRSFSLAPRGRYVLTTSAEPCAMCFGALPWSGICRLEYAATRDDVEAIGFDEGPKSSSWEDDLRQRAIDVHGPFLRPRAAALLRRYADRGGSIYNGTPDP